MDGVLAALQAWGQRAPGQRPTILIADDEEIYRRSLASQLRESAGSGGSFDIVEAATTDEAIRIACETDPELIFLDVDFRNGARSGFDVAKYRRDQRCHSQICFHTNHPVDSVRQRSAAAGVGDAYWLAKPADVRHLVAILSETAQVRGAFSGVKAHSTNDL